MAEKSMTKKLQGLMNEVLGPAAPDVEKELKKAKRRRRLAMGKRLTFKEVNEAAKAKNKVWVAYYDRDGRIQKEVMVASRMKDGGWDFDGGLGAVIVEKDGHYGPTHDGKQIKRPKPDWMFEATYVDAVYEAR